MFQVSESKIEKRSLEFPEQRRDFEKGKVELVTMGDITFGRATLQPGWRWSECVQPIAKTRSCEEAHLQYHVAGHLRVRMDDGTEEDFFAGDVSSIPPGHDAWVVGHQPVVVIDIAGMSHFAEAGR